MLPAQTSQTAIFFSQPSETEGDKSVADSVARKASTIELPAVSSGMAAMTAIIRGQ